MAPRIHMIAATTDSLILACHPGRCGTCEEMHSLFVCREGKSQCVDCDRKEREQKAKGATA
jgi:hypothetical protein